MRGAVVVDTRRNVDLERRLDAAVTARRIRYATVQSPKKALVVDSDGFVEGLAQRDKTRDCILNSIRNLR